MRHLRLLRPVRGLLVGAIVLQATSSMLALVPLLVLLSFTGAWLGGTEEPGAGIVISALVSTVGAALSAATASWLTHRADALVSGELRTRLAAVIRHAPLPTVTGLGAARIRAVVHDDTAALHYLLAHTLLDLTTVVMTPVMGVIALAVIDVRFALLGLVPLVLGILWFLRAMAGSGANFAEYATAQQQINGTIVDYVRGLPVAKIYGGPGGSHSRYTAAVHGFHDFFRRWSGATSAVTTASWLVVAPGLTAGAIAILGGCGLLAGVVSPTALLAGVLLGPAISAPVAVAGPRIQAIRTGLASLASIERFLSQPRLAWGKEDPPPRGATVRAEKVTVRYEDHVALQDVSFTLPARGLVALVGASGSGKSTIAGLLARFADPSEGAVRLGAQRLGDLSERALYERIAFVFQDTALRDASVRDLLTGGRDIPGEKVVAAAQAAAVHEVVQSLPHGYDTVLGEETALSGGQRQRIALARALLREPDLLVLDETLSALDTATRLVVLKSLRAQAATRTVLLISHQLPLVRDADLILVLDEGLLQGQGTHDELRRSCPVYERLWTAQTEGQEQ